MHKRSAQRGTDEHKPTGTNESPARPSTSMVPPAAARRGVERMVGDLDPVANGAGRLAQQRELADWKSWLRQIPWTIWVHPTFKSLFPPSVDDAYRKLELYGERLDRRFSVPLYLGVIEGSPDGPRRTHAHLLIAGLPARPENIDLLRGLWRRIGRVSAEEFDRGQEGVNYVLKHVPTEAALIVCPNFRHRVRTVRWHESVVANRRG